MLCRVILAGNTLPELSDEQFAQVLFRDAVYRDNGSVVLEQPDPLSVYAVAEHEMERVAVMHVACFVRPPALTWCVDVSGDADVAAATPSTCVHFSELSERHRDLKLHSHEAAVQRAKSVRERIRNGAFRQLKRAEVKRHVQLACASGSAEWSDWTVNCAQSKHW